MSNVNLVPSEIFFCFRALFLRTLCHFAFYVYTSSWLSIYSWEEKELSITKLFCKSFFFLRGLATTTRFRFLFI